LAELIEELQHYFIFALKDLVGIKIIIP